MSGREEAVGFRRDVVQRLIDRDPHGDAVERLDRARGCLVGGAIGDALGAPIEFLSRADIVSTFGRRGLQDLAPAYGIVGALTDDTQMTLFTAEGLLRAYVRFASKGIGPVFVSVMDAAYQRWLTTQETSRVRTVERSSWAGWLTSHPELHATRAPGTTCLAALRGKTTNGAPAVNASKGCGGVMRVAPLGIFFARYLLGQEGRVRDRDLFEQARQVAGLTHGHVTGQVTAGYLAVLVGSLICGESWDVALERAWAPLIRAAGHRETSGLVVRALEAAASEPGLVRQVASLGEGWIAEEALAIGLYCAASAIHSMDQGGDAVRDALLLAVNHGGDSDSTGSITGNILGAFVGYEALPTTWKQSIELGQAICEMAEDLVTFPHWDVSPDGNALESAFWIHRYPPS